MSAAKENGRRKVRHFFIVGSLMLAGVYLLGKRTFHKSKGFHRLSISALTRKAPFLNH
jgi:hypothetical protein